MSEFSIISFLLNLATIVLVSGVGYLVKRLDSAFREMNGNVKQNRERIIKVEGKIDDHSANCLNLARVIESLTIKVQNIAIECARNHPNYPSRDR